MIDFCIHSLSMSEDDILATLTVAGLTALGMDGQQHPIGAYNYVGQVVETPGEYGPDFEVITAPVLRSGVYAIYRATNEQSAALLAATLPADVSLVDPPARLQRFGGEWMKPDLEAAIAAKGIAIQAAKVNARDAGFFVDDVLFDSDQSARTAYLELADMLAQDDSYATPWKASPGAWVTMNAALYAKVKAAGTAHVSACFAWQAARDAELATIRAAVADGSMSLNDASAAVAAVVIDFGRSA